MLLAAKTEPSVTIEMLSFYSSFFLLYKIDVDCSIDPWCFLLFSQ